MSTDVKDLGEQITEESLDVTSRIEVYENGKTFTCDCGQGVGIKLHRLSVKCATCGVICYDVEHAKREPNPRTEDGGQTTLGDW